MPLVDHHEVQDRKQILRVGAAEHQAQAFRCRHQRAGQQLVLPRALGAAGMGAALVALAFDGLRPR